MHIKKRRFRNKSNNTKLAALILVVLVFVCATGYAYFSQSLDLTSTAKLNTDNPFCDLTMFDGYKNFEVTYDYDYYVGNNQVTSTSPMTYAATAEEVDVDVKITIKNTGDKTVNMWRLFLKFPLGANIVNFWNSIKVYEGEVSDGLMLIYEPPSLTFNNLMAPGEEVIFNIMYKSTTNSPDILAAGVYGWNVETESVPTAEEMAACVFDKNSSTGGSGNTGGGDSGNTGEGGESGGDSGNTGEGGESGGDSGNTGEGGESGGDSGNTGEGGESGGDSGNTGTDQNAIIASITSDYSYDYNTLKMYVVKVQLTNKTNEDIRNWYVDIDIGEGGEALGCWSATCSLNNNVVHITEAAWGSIVNGNSSTVIEFQFATNNYEPKLVGYGLVE